MQLFESLGEAIEKYCDNNAFCIDGTYYSYYDLAEKISGIRTLLNMNSVKSGRSIGLVTNDDLETYAAIIAIWLEGNYYVPLSPQLPAERIAQMIRQADIKTIIDSSATVNFPECLNIESKRLPLTLLNLQPRIISGEALAYILFTSGTTGIPKGVPITRNNLSEFIDSFFRIGLDTDEKDKWLQMFELTFDLSIFSYLVPLLQGACIYTVPQKQIKYNYIFRLFDENNLTVALMIPTVIHFLRPYFSEINNRTLRYSLFCGESLSLEITEKWSLCVPEAEVLNVYGPSEATIFCTYYSFNRNASNKTQNGILSIGKPMEGIHAIIVDDKNHTVKDGEKGELCLSGRQITPGYLKNDVKNKMSFFEMKFKTEFERFYKTGDLCFMDIEGDIMFVERVDTQIKINGFRVELSEIEFRAKMYLTEMNVVALAYRNELENMEIGLCIESKGFDIRNLTNYLKEKLPSYMVPVCIKFESVFPLNKHGKMDRQELLKRFLQK
jgi:D-alanine--poly(phosphoribitol) ligase subunit 1